MSFDARIGADRLGDALAPVSALVDECKLRTFEDGVEIRAVDPANVGMVDMSLPSTEFDKFDAGEHVLGVNLERVEEVLSLADADESVRLRLERDSGNLHIDIGGLEYTLALIDPDSIRQEPDIPDLDLPATYVLPGSEVDRAVTACDLVSDHICLSGHDDEIVVAADGDTDDVELSVNGESLIDAPHDSVDDPESLFSLSYIENMSQPLGGDTDVSVQLGEEMPVKLRYSIGDVSVVNMLAPRIQSEGQ